MENKEYLVEIYGSHDVFARNEREAREKTVDWLQQHWCFVSFDVQEFGLPPKEGSLAARQMRDTPLKRQNIHVHEDDMESTCPACGYMLYEEANMIFNYCPTCGQALNNNDFSEEDE